MERKSKSYLLTVNNDKDGLNTLQAIRKEARRLKLRVRSEGRNPNRVQFLSKDIPAKRRAQARRETVGTHLSVAQSTRFDVYAYDQSAGWGFKDVPSPYAMGKLRTAALLA